MEASENSEEMQQDVAESTVDTKGRTLDSTEGNSGDVIGLGKNVDCFEILECNEMKPDVFIDSENTATPYNSPISLSKVQSCKTFIGIASENTSVVVNTSVESMLDDRLHNYNDSNTDKNSTTSLYSFAEKTTTVSEDTCRREHSSSIEVMNEIESIELKKLSHERSKDCEISTGGEKLSLVDKSEKIKESSTALPPLRSGEINTNEKMKSSLVLPVITVTAVSDVEDNDDSDEGPKPPAKEVLVSKKKIENESTFSEGVKASENEIEDFKNLQSVVNEVQKLEHLDEIRSIGDSKSVDNKRIAGASDIRITFDAPSDEKELVSTQEISRGGEKQTADSQCATAELVDNNEVSNGPQQDEERNSFFYISSSELQPPVRERSCGYTNVAFEYSDGISESENPNPLFVDSSYYENNQPGPSECLGSAYLHGGIIMFSIFIAFIGYSIYNLAQLKKVPDFYEIIGLSTSAIAAGVAVLSALYIGVQWCARNLSKWLPLQDYETMPLTHRVKEPYPFTREENGYADSDRASRQPDWSPTESFNRMLRLHRHQSSTSPAALNLKRQVLGLLDTLSDTMDKQRLQDSTDADFAEKDVEDTLISEHSVYPSAELPSCSKASEELDES